MLPKEFGGAVNLFIHPMAGAAAMSALGFGSPAMLSGCGWGRWRRRPTPAAHAGKRFETAFEAKREAQAAQAGRLELVSRTNPCRPVR
jgi:NADH-quinone oxidoreductase subunit E